MNKKAKLVRIKHRKRKERLKAKRRMLSAQKPSNSEVAPQQ